MSTHPSQNDAEIDENDFEGALTGERIREHYQRSRPAYEALSAVEGNPTVAKAGDYGLYTYRANDDAETAGEWPRVGHPMTFGNDFDALAEKATKGVGDYPDTRERTLYAHTSYNEGDYVRQWYRNRDADSKDEKWDIDDKNPMPGRRETRAIAAWGDIDLDDDVKPRRPELTDDEIETVEAAIEAYVEEYADLYGSRDAVYALDSVGGLYIMGAPEATLPATSALRDDPEGRDWFVEAFIDRSNEYLKAAEERVNERVDSAAELIDPDWCNNKNRPYKAPLSIHAKHDAVVTPIDTDAPRYEFTPIEAVDDELIDETTEWARSFTADDHAACIDSLIEALWPDEYDETGSWIKAIRLWVENEREAELKRELERERIQEHRRNRDQLRKHGDGQSDETPPISTSGSETTPYIGEVFAAVEQVDIKPLVKSQIPGTNWEPTGRDNHFNPGKKLWKESDSGETCFIDESENVFGDVGETNGGGYPVDFMAIVDGALDDPSDCPASGADFWAGVEALREEDYDIPVWTPDAPEVDGDQMPLWSLRQFAIAHEIVDEDDLKEQENDDGETYLGFKSRDYRRAVLWAEEAGLDTGRLAHLD